MPMTEEARQARNAYHRAWRKNHPEEAKKIQERYWSRKAKEISPAVEEAEMEEKCTR